LLYKTAVPFYTLGTGSSFWASGLKERKNMQSNVRNALSNIRGGLAGVFIYLVITILAYFLAFMVAFGNNTAVARSILAFEEIFFLVANPLWTIPLSYFLGGYFLFTDRSSINPDRGE
jgi:hypothetical protein